MKVNARTGLRIVAILVVIAVLAWQWWGKSHRRDGAARGSVAVGADASPTGRTLPSSATPAQPAPPAKLTRGRLVLTACELKQPDSAATTPAFCAAFPVPENRADPRSRTIDLKLAIVKSSSAVPDRDLVVYLAGGPGQSAIQTYPEVAPALAPLLKHHDLLLLDQRGTGGSHPLRCPDVEKRMDKLTNAATPAERADLVGECAAEVGKTSDPRFYTTTAAVADLEAVREALGGPRLDLVGVSYGTRMAQHYAMAHPAAVRSIVLDGVVPNQLVLGEGFAAALQRSLALQSAACARAPACHRAFGDWLATLMQMHAMLQREPPLKVTFADPFTYKPVTHAFDADTLAGVVRFFSYSAATMALLPLAVHEAAQGDYAPLMGQSGILARGVAESMQAGMQLSVICTEDAPLLKPDPADADTLLGTRLVAGLIAECGQWPHGPMPKDFHAPFTSSIPTLLVSGEFDPVTPPGDAAQVLKGLSDARSLVVQGLGHAEAINAGCMPRLVDAFIDRLRPKQLDAGCLKRIGPIPAFVNFNGAAP